MNKENKVFCILPWVHAQVRQNGEVYPCCRLKHSYSYGSTYEKSLNEIWNSEEVKKVRREMLQGKAQSFCSDCYTIEELGGKSYRQTVNQDYQDELVRLNQTDETGFLNNEDIIYLDIRFSNICNFKCRSCNPGSSNSWHDDYQEVYKNWSSVKRTYKLSADSKTAMGDIEKLLPKIKKIYFAGGEPLLDENHYRILEKLIELGRTDVFLTYNTNISFLNYKNWNVLQLWKKFECVQVSASIDAIGLSLELIRKGAVWDDIKKNLILIQKLTPEVLLQIYPTLSVLNCFKITELIDYFLDKNFFEISRHFEINLLNDPDYINISILTPSEINNLEQHYLNYLNSIKDKAKKEVFLHIKSELARVIKYARHQNLTHLRGAFKIYTFRLDRLRKEKTIEIFPELFNLLYE